MIRDCISNGILQNGKHLFSNSFCLFQFHEACFQSYKFQNMTIYSNIKIAKLKIAKI